MSSKFSYKEFYNELESSLPTSSGESRKIWVKTVLERKLKLKDLSGLLLCDQKIATRFLWLMSEVGIANPSKLFAELPYLLDFCEQLNPEYKKSFASYWLIAGVPPENESRAIDLLFHWLLSNNTNITIKARSFLVLYELTKKYPELKNELKLCLTDQMDKYSKDFKKRAAKILTALEQD
jgi:hypothetical protein